MKRSNSQRTTDQSTSLVMKNSLVLALFFVLFFAALSTSTTNALVGVGDQQLLMAFNAGYYEVVQSGEYDTILEKWGVGGFKHDQCHPRDSPLNQWPENPEGLLRTILVQSRVIAIGHDIGGHPPFWNGTGGLDDDLANAVIRRIGIHYNVPDLGYRWVSPIIDTSGFFDSLYKNLETLGSDIIISNVGITPSRQEVVDFSCPYLYASSAIIRGLLDPQLTLTTLESLDAPGVKVAIQKGTIYEPFAATNLTRATVYIEDNLYKALGKVADEEAHVALTSEAFVAALRPTFQSLEGNTLHNVTVYPYGEPVAFGACVRKGEFESSSSSAAPSLITAKSMVQHLLIAVVLASAAFVLALVA